VGYQGDANRHHHQGGTYKGDRTVVALGGKSKNVKTLLSHGDSNAKQKLLHRVPPDGVGAQETRPVPGNVLPGRG